MKMFRICLQPTQQAPELDVSMEERERGKPMYLRDVRQLLNCNRSEKESLWLWNWRWKCRRMQLKLDQLDHLFRGPNEHQLTIPKRSPDFSLFRPSPVPLPWDAFGAAWICRPKRAARPLAKWFWCSLERNVRQIRHDQNGTKTWRIWWFHVVS